MEIKNLKETVENLKRLRAVKGLTQQQVADKLGISRTAFNKWENSVNEIPTEFLFKIADLYGLSEEEKEKMSKSDHLNEGEMEVINSYEKVISFMKAALLVSFENEFFNSTFPIDVPFGEFEELNDESISKIELTIGNKLTKDLYLEYCEQIEEEVLNDHYYSAFSSLLKENPLAASLFHFGLLGNKYDDFFKKWCKEEKQKRFLNMTEELKIEMKKFKSIINSERLESMYEIFDNSINQNLVFKNTISNSWLKYF